MGVYFQHYENESRASLGQLTRRRRLVFVLIVCRRFKPYYVAFTKALESADPGLFDRVEAALLRAIANDVPSVADLEELKKSVDSAYPAEDVVEGAEDIEIAWLAQDALDVCLHAIGVITEGAVYENDGEKQFHDELEHVWWVANACYDAADREASMQVLPDGGFYTPEVEGRIARSSPIEREVTWQFETLELLAGVDDDEPVPHELVDERSSEPLLGRLD